MRSEWQSYWKETLKTARSGLLALGVSLVFWVFNLSQLQSGEYGISLFVYLVYGATIFAYIWVAYALVYAFLTTRQLTTGKAYKKLTWGVHIPLSLFATSMGLVTAKWFEALIMGREFSTSGILDSILIGSFIAFMFMFYYAYKHSAEENMALKAAKAESELHILKNQMQPHFLFNSLNSLSELIETNKDSAAEMAMKLSDLYREILENSKKSLVSLDSEVSIIKKYLELEQVRFGERLKFEIEVPKNAGRIMLPPLVLQTLVENAVKHGIAPSPSGGTVNVSIWSNGKPGYHLRVINTASTAAKTIGCKTGLTNTKARLDLLYGSQHGFELKDQGPTVEASFWFSGESIGG